MAERCLIVNADDFGIATGVNRAIAHACRHGILTAASLMANMPAATDAVATAADTPRLDVGLHFNLTTGKPLSAVHEVSTLVDGHGQFHSLGSLLLRLSSGAVKIDEVRRELEAQLEWTAVRGLQISHVDSHHHVHAHPRIARSVAALCRDAAISHLRVPIERSAPWSVGAKRARDLARMIAIGGTAAFSFGARPRVAFRGIGLGIGFGTQALVHLLGRLPLGFTELMVHPAYVSAELSAATSAVTGRETELEALCAEEVRAELTARGVRLTSFRELPADLARSAPR